MGRIASGDWSDLTEQLCAIAAEVLGVPTVAPDATFFSDLGADSLTMAKFCATVRKRPELPRIAMKDIYRWPSVGAIVTGLTAAPAAVPVPRVGVESAPAPAFLGAGRATEVVEPPTPPAPIEPVGLVDFFATLQAYRQILTELLAGVDVSPGAHVFDDLGADSMTMARFCATVRKRADLPNVSMKDVYRHPTLAELAAAVAPGAAALPPTVLAPTAGPAVPVAPEPAEPVRLDGSPASFGIDPVGRLSYVFCGVAQLLILLLLPVLVSAASVVGYRWLTPANGLVENYLRAVTFAAGGVLACFLLPVALKWTLIGRWQPTTIRVWSPGYLRFWVVKLVVQRNPLILIMLGSPLYGVYLRALGARIGRGTTILTNQVPLCTDLFSVGEDTVIRRDAVLPGYHAEAGVIRTGRITLGDRVVVSAKTVIDIETSMGDDAQLGHASSLHPGQSVPAGERWYGSPAGPGNVDFGAVEPDPCRSCSRRRRTLFGISQLVWTILFTLPLGLAVLDGFWNLAIKLTGGVPGSGSVSSAQFYGTAATAATVLFFGVLLIVFPVLNVTARALSLLVRPGKVYRLHGVRHSALRTITRFTNMKFYAGMVADSSYVVYYLRALGYRLTPVLQTGTNFGTVAHDTPFAARVGTGTVVADGLSINNVDYSASTFRVAPVAVGAHSFLGNGIAYPPRAMVGDNCLIGTMTMIPIDGPVREGVGLLGSPPFEIPRTVARDTGFAIEDPAELRRGLRRKNRHNTVTLLMFLLVRWIGVFSLFVFGEIGGDAFTSKGGPWGLALAEAGYGVCLFLFYLGVERAFTRYASLCPDGVSIYDNRFWRHERYWKVPSRGYVQFLNGTPFKSVVLRLLGMKVGKRVFDDGASFPEKSFVTIGDYATLNASSGAQTHSQEDGAFKSDRTVVGAGVTLGVASFVHYGVTIGEGVVLAADSFLMKGEQVPAGEYWAGNPAQAAEPFLSRPQPAVVPATPEPVPLALEVAAEPAVPTASARPAARSRGRLIALLYSIVLAVGGVLLLIEPGWDRAWRGVGVLALVVAAGLDAVLLRRAASPDAAAPAAQLTDAAR